MDAPDGDAGGIAFDGDVVGQHVVGDGIGPIGFALNQERAVFENEQLARRSGVAGDFGAQLLTGVGQRLIVEQAGAAITGRRFGDDGRRKDADIRRAEDAAAGDRAIAISQHQVTVPGW